MNSKTGLMVKSASAPPSPKASSCASGHILLVSMQKLRNPAFQRFGADLRKTLMITSVVKQARKFYQLGSDVPINCGCIRAESVFIMPAQAASIETSSMDRVESERLISAGDGCDRPSTPAPSVISPRKHSLSSMRKSRKPKVAVAVVTTDKDVNRDVNGHNDTPTALPSSKAGQITDCPTSRVVGQSNQHSHKDSANPILNNRRSQSVHVDANGGHSHSQQQLLIVARYFQLNHHQQSSDDTPPIKKRRLAFLPHEPNSICITASVC